MQRNLSLRKRNGRNGARKKIEGALGKLEEMVGKLLTKYHELKKERDELSVALDQEREKGRRLEKKPGRPLRGQGKGKDTD